MFCKYCGSEINNRSRFCKCCGIKVSSNVFFHQFKNRLGIFFDKYLGVIVLILMAVFVIILFNGSIKKQNYEIENVPKKIVDHSPYPSSTAMDMQRSISKSVVNIVCTDSTFSEKTSGGSGTIITKNGIILTNSHIIPRSKNDKYGEKTQCIVSLPDPKYGQPDSIYWAEPIIISNLSDEYDLAYLKITGAYYSKRQKKYLGEYPREFPAFENDEECCSKPQLGEPIRIFGYPSLSGGTSLTVTEGIVSSFPGEGLIVTSAKMSSGNSGGLAVDLNGCMVGVPSMSSSDDTETLGVIISKARVDQFEEELSALLGSGG